MIDANDLAVWWRAVLDRMEQAAREASLHPPAPAWRASGNGVYSADVPDDISALNVAGSDWDEVAAHIALHDPAAVLASVAADRALLEFCAQMLRQGAAPGDSPDDVDPTCWYVLRLRAAAYADWPGYRDEWRPQ